MNVKQVKRIIEKEYPQFSYHHLRFWGDNATGYFCQAFLPDTKEFYGWIYKINLQTKHLVAQQLG